MTQEDKDYIIKYYSTLTAREIGEKLGRTVGAIHIYARKLGVTGPNNVKKIRKKTPPQICNNERIIALKNADWLYSRLFFVYIIEQSLNRA